MVGALPREIVMYTLFITTLPTLFGLESKMEKEAEFLELSHFCKAVLGPWVSSRDPLLTLWVMFAWGSWSEEVSLTNNNGAISNQNIFSLTPILKGFWCSQDNNPSLPQLCFTWRQSGSLCVHTEPQINWPHFNLPLGQTQRIGFAMQYKLRKVGWVNNG